MIPQIRYELAFPNPNSANEAGIVAWGGDLSPNRILLAYRNGIFPWYAQGDPILWWSPNPRLILNLNDFKLRRSLKKRLKHFEIRVDSAFNEVIQACATTFREDQEGTWILPEMIEAYNVLHEMGYAHSVEAYQDDKLVGGLYGVAIGKVFCGESMFATVNDASKVAFASLIEYLKEWGYEFIDSQVPTLHVKSLGGVEISRDMFLQRLKKAVNEEVSKDSWIFTPKA